MLPQAGLRVAVVGVSLLAALAFGPRGAGPADEASERVHEDPVLGFRFLYPGDWKAREVRDIGPQAVVEVTAPGGASWIAVHAARSLDGAFAARRLRTRMDARFPGAAAELSTAPVTVADRRLDHTRVDVRTEQGPGALDFYEIDVGGRSFLIEFGSLGRRRPGTEEARERWIQAFEVRPMGREPRARDPLAGQWDLVTVATLPGRTPVPLGWTVRTGDPAQAGLLAEMDDPAGLMAWEIYKPDLVSPFEGPFALMDRLVATLGVHGFVIGGTGSRRIAGQRLPFAEGYYQFRDVPCRVAIYAFRRDGQILLGYLSQVLPVSAALEGVEASFVAPYLSAGPDAVEGTLERAQEALDAGRAEASLAIVDERLRVLPNEPEAVMMRIEALSDLGRHDEATAVARALEASADAIPSIEARERMAAVALVARSQAAAGRGRLAEARALARAAVASSPGASTLIEARAMRLVSAGHGDAARAVVEGPLQERPEDPALLRGMAWVLATAPGAGARDPGRALELARRAVAAQPDSFLGWRALAAALQSAGRLQEAVRAQEASVAAGDLRPEDAGREWDRLRRLRELAGEP